MVLNRALILGALALTTMMSSSGGEDIVGGFFASQANHKCYNAKAAWILTGQLPTLREKEEGAGPLLRDIVPKVKPTVFKTDHVGSYGTEIYQSHGPSGQYTQEFDGDEMFYVDLGKKETVWRLPMFSQFAGFDPQFALSEIATAKFNLDLLTKRSNFTPVINEVPEVTVFSKSPVMLGQPNTLICHVDNIFPPVINITWLKNGHAVTEGVSETSFLPKDDHSFLKIGYLTFLPSDNDIYDCKVEHWGLDEPLLKHWEPEVPAPMSELTETVVCALGLTVGLVGIVVGTIFIIQGLRSGGASRHQGPL